jgi:hypothetical protein
MPLNILRHKSWHPGNAEARARVARDEAAAAAAAAATAARAAASEGEARLELLRARAGLPPAGGTAPRAAPPPAAAATASAAPAPPPPETRLGFGAAELAGDAQPFYHRLDGGPALRHTFFPRQGGSAEDVARALARDRARLEAADPLKVFSSRLATAAPAAAPRKRRWEEAEGQGGGGAAPAPPAPLPDAQRLLPGGKTFAQLREERLQREAAEGRKAAEIMRRR